MRKQVRFVHSLSFKLALTTVGMLLVLWLTVGTVLVLSTAQEIIDNGPSAGRQSAQSLSFKLLSPDLRSPNSGQFLGSGSSESILQFLSVSFL